MQKGRFDQRRTGQGYKAPSERDGCRNCTHRSAAALGADPDGRIAFNCKQGGFLVAPGGICSKHQLAGIAAVPRTETSHDFQHLHPPRGFRGLSRARISLRQP